MQVKSIQSWDGNPQTFEQGLSARNWYLNNEKWLHNITSGEYATHYEKQYN
jgi:dTDP-glucose 4,6-dehydratase